MADVSFIVAASSSMLETRSNVLETVKLLRQQRDEYTFKSSWLPWLDTRDFSDQLQERQTRS